MRHCKQMPTDVRARLMMRAREYEEHLRAHPEDLLGRDPRVLARQMYGLEDQPARQEPDEAFEALPDMPREIREAMVQHFAQAQREVEVMPSKDEQLERRRYERHADGRFLGQNRSMEGRRPRVVNRNWGWTGLEERIR